ncbi:MAG: hypothetical protein Q9214_007437 [Letrouitia sp. 1 TL-2023]
MDDPAEEPPLARLARRLTLKTESQRQQKLGKDRETLAWLSPIDTETNYKRACHLHQPGTGQWFLKREEFKNWASGGGSFIWLHGIQLKQRQQSSEGDDVFSLSYHYLDFKDQRSLDPVTLLGSIIKELHLSLPQTELFKGIQSLYDFHYDKSSGQAQKPPFEDLVSLLIDFAETLPYVLIVVDGLDECPQEYQDQVLCPALKSITSQSEARIGFLVTSREESNIETAFAGLAEVGMSKDNVASDVSIYVEAEIERRASLRNLDLELRDEISKALIAGAQGMFRWVSCQIEVLANARNEGQIALSLKKLPKTLYETYDRIVDNISADDTKRARRSLTWLANSPRQMSSDELIEGRQKETRIRRSIS